MEAVYNHKAYEEKWIDFWEKGRYFHAEVDKSKTPYTIIIPPPNVTDKLHMGHGLNVTIQDILMRWKRMSGYNCCWLPGTDHAGIATQMMVEKSLEAEGTSKKELGREAFFDKCVEWKDKYGDQILHQQRRLGASVDWDRKAYTMDEHLSKAVRKIFVKLFEDGLIYQGERLVNWDPKIQTAISDDEIENKNESGFLWHFSYPVENEKDTFITIATTRPETMLGDTAVAVHPEDERYSHLVGKSVRLPFTGRLIPIIADDYVKMEFGTGCVKITPAHDPNDFEIGKRHSLPFITILNDDGTIADNCPTEFVGLDRFVARKKIIKELKALELFVEEEPCKHSVPYSDRGKVPIEPKLSKQWFVNMKGLAQLAIQAAKDGDLNFFPDSWKKTYFHWLDNIQDWCISRQLWWGHRIPIWHCDDCGNFTTGMEDPTACSHCGSSKLEQETDVLDTWFSSWLWPISPFGWPDDSEDLKYFYPSNVLVTGAEIIFLWVARMVMVGYYTQGKSPFSDVYFNSIVCDVKGRKMSKTLGNGIDPLKIIDSHGADSVRYTCISLAPIGGRVKIGENDFDHASRFINKLWNAARFVKAKIEDNGDKPIVSLDLDKLDPASYWLISEVMSASKAINQNLEDYHLNEAVERIYHLAWGSFCDWGLEASKLTIEQEGGKKDQALSAIVYALEAIMRLAAPVIPFVTEEIWSHLPHHPDWKREESLAVSAYPKGDELEGLNPKVAHVWRKAQDMVSAVRSVRSQATIPPKDLIEVHLKIDQKFQPVLEQCEEWMKSLAKIGSLNYGESIEKPSKSLIAVGAGFEVYVPAEKYLDFDKELARLESEKARVQKIVKGLEGKLGNKNFVDRAPAEVVDETKAKLSNMVGQLDGLKKNIASLKEST